MSQYKTITTTPAGAPAVTMARPAAHSEPNKPDKPAKADHTTEMVKERIEPGRDIFAEPIQDDNKVKAETTGGVDPAVLVEEQKAKDERMRSAIESLKTKVGPLSPSEAIAKAAIEQAEYNAIVKDPSKDDSERKEDERNTDSPVPQREETEEKAKAVEEKVANPKEDAHDKEEKEKDESISSIQPAPSSTGDDKEAEEEAKKTRSPEEIEADRVRQELFGKDKD
jgi:hypothetical protein